MVLELFCGTKSISKAFEKAGHETRTLDHDPQFEPTYCMDIMDFTQKQLDGWVPDMIWASPDCSCYSVASIGTHWTGGAKAYQPKSEEAMQSMHILFRTVNLINAINPKIWFIENPRGMMRKVIPVHERYRKTVTYCQYGDTRMKPTDIWTNLADMWEPRGMCKNGDACHEPAPRGSKTGTQGLRDSKERARIPEELCNEIVWLCEDYYGIKKE